jgi:hypothetical protein
MVMERHQWEEDVSLEEKAIMHSSPAPEIPGAESESTQKKDLQQPKEEKSDLAKEETSTSSEEQMKEREAAPSPEPLSTDKPTTPKEQAP